MATTPPPYNDPRWQRYAAREQARAQREAWRAYARAQKQQWRGYQRTSIIGPLLLIAVGVVFLLIHFGRISSPVFFAWYGRWWPMLLIVIGLLRLGEWLWARRTVEQGKPAPRYTLGAIAGLALFLLVLFGIGTTAFTHTNNNLLRFSFNGEDWEKFAGTKHEADPAPSIVALPAGSAIFIENPHGDVSVTGLSDDGQLHVQAHQEIYVRRDSEADEALRGLNPDISNSGNNFSIKVPAKPTGSVDLTVQVPGGTAVTVNSGRGDVHVGNIRSGVKITANRGDVDVKAITGPVVARVNHRDASLSIFNVTGSVSVEGRGDALSVGEINGSVNIKGDFFSGGHLQHVRGPIDLNTGKITLSLARLDGEINLDESDEIKVEQAAGPLVLNTQKRNVSVTRVTGQVSVANSYGDVNIASTAPVGPITVENHNGEVEVSLPSRSAFTVQANTSDGDVHSDFTLASKTSDNAGNLSGTVNGGGLAINLSTTHGDISIKRADLPALSPLPKAPSIAAPVPPLPPVPAMANDAQEALRDAQQQLRQAQEEVKRAQAQAERETKQALAEAKREREHALADAKRDREQDRRDREREQERRQRERDRQQDSTF
ncbi:MAG: DUF4097 family beta strand repeat protein [Acidobacteria bacterium]|nr:DUF4097 family beta strand repeat protein [Acidobacteriota bacterium]